jgi:F-type H+-transporting ATPase subunit epsilon
MDEKNKQQAQTTPPQPIPSQPEGKPTGEIPRHPVKNSIASLSGTDVKLMYLRIKAPEKNLFEGIVESITSHNAKGSFDILPYHENFISLIDGKLIYREPGKPGETIDVGQGILEFSHNQAQIYIGMEALPAQQPNPTSPPPPDGKKIDPKKGK